MYGGLGQQVFQATKNNTKALEDIVGNISNMKTIGYKQSSTTFSETLDGQVKSYSQQDFAQGPIRKTNGELDIAIKGKGFLQVELPNGQRGYTRVGRLRLSSEGELVTMEGYKVMPFIEGAAKPVPVIFDPAKVNNGQVGLNLKVSSPKLIIPSDLTVKFEEDGTIKGINQTSGEKVKLGKLNIVAFNNTDGLKAVGKSYFVQTKSSGQPQEVQTGMDGQTQIMQGALEHSNVDVASTFMELAQMKNMLGANFKVLKAIDKIYESVHYTISRST